MSILSHSPLSMPQAPNNNLGACFSSYFRVWFLPLDSTAISVTLQLILPSEQKPHTKSVFISDVQ
jgi:hypothetical protein